MPGLLFDLVEVCMQERDCAVLSVNIVYKSSDRKSVV